MKKISGILLLLVYVLVATTLLNERFVGAFNMQNITRWSSLFGILGIGVAFVIITGGIDLSIGSVVGLIGCLLPMMLLGTAKWPPGEVASLTAYMAGAELFIVAAVTGAMRWRARSDTGGDYRAPIGMAIAGLVSLVMGAVVSRLPLPGWVSIVCVIAWVMMVALHLGLAHGLLVTRARLQPFVVTLCGLLIYRGLARWITDDQTQGFGTAYDDSLRLIATGKPCYVALVVFVAGVLAVLAGSWTLLRQRRGGDNAAGRGLAWFTVVAGAAIATIGAVRYLPEGTLLGLSAAAAPGRLMSWIGWLVAPSVLWLGYVSFRANGRSMAGPVVAAVAAVLLLVGALAVVGKDDEWFWGGRDWASRWRMAAVFLSLGGLMASVAWFGRNSLRAGSVAQVPMAASGMTAVMWLMSRPIGKSSLADTLLGEMLVPAPFFVLVAMAAAAAVFLNLTIYGRYLLALGRNEQAARYSGIKTDRLVVLSYVICGGAAGLGGILFALDGNSVQPSGQGNLFELYAIAAAVLGGCSLRGGEGSILGVVIGATVMRVLYNSINILGIKSQLEYTIIGVVILAGVIADEAVKRITARRRSQESK
jgi:ribose/xylose/arabinose/galactoside ABC-type transport system permease subunit